MRHLVKIIFVILALCCLQFGLAGCFVGPGYHRDGWYHDGPWMDGGPRVGVGIDVHPAGYWH